MAFAIAPEQQEKPLPQPETVSNHEAEVEVLEQPVEQQQAVQYVEQAPKAQPEMPRVPDARNVMEVRSNKDPLLQNIENALADESILKIYNTLPADKQDVFRETGEKLAKDIRGWITSKKIKPHAILKGVRAWLRQVSGVNMWYLEQEAKNKVDSVLELAETAEKANNAM